VVSTNIAANIIESPGLSGSNNPKSRGDGSFDTELETAKKKILLFAPWADVSKMFNIMPLEFKFDFNTSRIEESTQKKYNEPAKIKPEQSTAQKEIKTQDEGETISIVNIPKETFKKNLPAPLPFCPIAIPGFSYGNSAKPITKQDLQLMVDEIVEKIELLKVGRRSELNMSLSNEKLGDLTLFLSLKNGLVSVQIAAAMPETKRSLEENLSELESALKSAKISLEDIRIVEVKNGDHTKRSG